MKKKKESLEKLFNPASIAVIGASRDQKSVGYGILKSLVRGCVLSSDYCKSFPGKVYPVNPKADYILGLKCYKAVKEIQEDIDLAVIAVPAKIVPAVLKDCGKKKVPFAVVISAGFSELGKEGKKLQDQIVKIAHSSNMRIVGPNCLGIVRPHANLNASFAPTMPPEGAVGFISQSGALADSIIDWAVEQRYGLSTLVSYGNHADLDVHEFIEYLAEDLENAIQATQLRVSGRFNTEMKKRLTRVALPKLSAETAREIEDQIEAQKDLFIPAEFGLLLQYNLSNPVEIVMALRGVDENEAKKILARNKELSQEYLIPVAPVAPDLSNFGAGSEEE